MNWEQTANAPLAIPAAADKVMNCRAGNGRVLKLPTGFNGCSVPVQIGYAADLSAKSGKPLTSRGRPVASTFSCFPCKGNVTL